MSHAAGSGNFGALHRPQLLAHSVASPRRWHVTTVRQYCAAPASTRAVAPVLRPAHAAGCRNQIANTNYIIAWGNNPGHLDDRAISSRFQEMMDNGGTLVHHRSVPLRDCRQAPRSGSSLGPAPTAAVALAMLKVVIDEGLTDEEYIIAHTTAPCLIDKKTERAGLR